MLSIVMWIVIVAALVGAVLSYTFLSWGFVITKLWAWLLVLPFGLTAITFSQAVAIAVILGIIKNFVNPELDKILNMSKELENSDPPKWGRLALSLSLPWITLIFAWLVKITFIA